MDQLDEMLISELGEQSDMGKLLIKEYAKVTKQGKVYRITIPKKIFELMKIKPEEAKFSIYFLDKSNAIVLVPIEVREKR